MRGPEGRASGKGQDVERLLGFRIRKKASVMEPGRMGKTTAGLAQGRVPVTPRKGVGVLVKAP